MQINSHYPHARGLGTKVGHPTGQTTIARPASRRPRGLASPAPWGFGFPVPWAVANPAERPQAAHSGNETASEKLSNQPMPGPFASRHSQRHRSTYQPKALEITPLAKRKASRAQHFSTSCAPARCRTSQLAVGAFASFSAWKAIATLGVRSGLILHRRGLMACETPSGLIIFYLSIGCTISLKPLSLKP